MNSLLNSDPTRWQDAPVRDLVEEQLTWFPRAPRNLEETGLNLLFLMELVTKILFHAGQIRLVELGQRIRLSVGVLEPVLAFMRSERLCEVCRRGEAETDITYTLTELGRVRAEDCLQKSRYAGPAPVTLDAYVRQI